MDGQDISPSSTSNDEDSTASSSLEFDNGTKIIIHTGRQNQINHFYLHVVIKDFCHKKIKSRLTEKARSADTEN